MNDVYLTNKLTITRELSGVFLPNARPLINLIINLQTVVFWQWFLSSHPIHSYVIFYRAANFKKIIKLFFLPNMLHECYGHKTNPFVAAWLPIIDIIPYSM